ncbi:hypothetical protein [Stenotrophomonas sepilia]|uniref:hypothetical protein n=1 Tax=Stenotrophomonas sepilia TaxID=2860290 RepID=UPI00333F40D7
MGYSIEDARQEMYEAELAELEREEELLRFQELRDEYASLIDKRRRRRRMIWLFSFVGIGALFSLLIISLLKTDSEQSLNLLARLLGAPDIRDGAKLILAFGLIATVAMSTLAYLNSPNLRSTKKLGRSSDFVELKRYIDSKFEQIPTESVSLSGDAERKDRKAAVDAIHRKLEEEACAEVFDKLKAEAAQAVRRDGLDARLSVTRLRLNQEVQALAKRGNLNLVLGIVTTLVGLVSLTYAVATAPREVPVDVLGAHFVPRLSLSILVEIFAYFFLKLYKQSLAEIKYFQNELTNVESRSAAVAFALESGEKNIASQIALELSRTERNFVLNKGQTTVELERERISSQNYERSIRAGSKLFRSFGRKS